MFPYVSRPVTITTGNRRLRFTEGANTNDADVATGTFHIIGDGSTNCLLQRLKTALENAGGSTNTYAVRMVFAPLDTVRPIRIVVERLTGSDNFGLLWGNSLTTLPGHIFGYAASTAVDANDKEGTVATSGVWLADEMLSEDDPDVDGQVFGDELATSGRYLAGSYSEPHYQHRWRLLRVGRARTWDVTPANPDLSWEAMWRRLRSGGACHLGRVLVDTASPVTYASATLDPLPGLWILDLASRQRVGPSVRNSTGVPSYAWSLVWRKRVAP